MHIEELVLEGFKSYATRTVISKWDPQFNAITGLNGSGKSNILDAICFVLGIDNLRQVRATTLQDLVYKRGQSGITKASVTIVFSNESQSPVGFADQKQITVTRQIVVSGKSRYLVNGHNTPQKVVESMFQSVQLNVNNPHFLIMQGQITKVLNMKSQEILAMIEETAGTRMFEDRRIKAAATMEKKERKVDEIQALLDDIIEPKLSGLKAERSDFVEFKRIEAELEAVARFVAAADYHASKQRLAFVETQLTEKAESVESIREQDETSRQELASLEGQIEEARRKRQRGSKDSEKLRQLEAQAKEATNQAVLFETQLSIKRASFEEVQGKVGHLRGDMRACKREEQESAEKLEATKAAFESAKDRHGQLQGKARQEEELLQSIATGVSASGDETGYAKLLNGTHMPSYTLDLKGQSSERNAVVQKAQLQLAELAGELNDLEPKAARAKKESAGKLKAINGLKAEAARLQEQLQHAVCEDGDEMSLLQEKKQLDSRLRRLSASVEESSSQLSHCSLDFQMDGVKGVVGSLIDVPAEHARYIDALEVTAGGKLYNIVTRDEGAANHLLDSGKLAKRVTIIPLNKVVPRTIPAEKIRLAKGIAGEQVHTALSLVGYEKDVEAAMQHVFGGTLICDGTMLSTDSLCTVDKDAASQLAFDKKILTRTVTVEGDVYEPSGTMTGGSAPRAGSILAKLSQHRDSKAELFALQQKLAEVAKRLDAIAEQRSIRDALKQKLELATHELQAQQRQFELDPMGKTINRIEAIKREIDSLERHVGEQSAIKSSLDRQLKEVEKDMQDFMGDREGKLQAIQKASVASKAALLRETDKLTKTQHAMQTAQAGHDRVRAALSRLEAELGACSVEAQQILDDIEALDKQLSRAAESAKAATDRLEGEMRHLRQHDRDLDLLEERRTFLQNEAEKMAIQQSRLADELRQAKEEGEKLHSSVSTALAHNSWIREAEPLFGKAGGQYDFAAQSAGDCRKRLRLLQEQHRKLKSTINTNVVEMIDRVEAKEASLRQMLSTVKRDKEKIEDTIGKINGYKVDALKKTWSKVNDDFGSIFAELLPGGFCKLDPPEGQSISDGLEIKVSLGGVWKQSLAELSGGQRSVVALSLVLSLLQFKPAPMYILDEIDAALDLSHTQNIGSLLRSRFHGSQFIVVSLKEGMFNNANVLFRTRFQDGVSTVERFEHGSDEAPQKVANKKGVRAVAAVKQRDVLV